MIFFTTGNKTNNLLEILWSQQKFLRYKLLSPNISKKSDENVFKNMKYNIHVYHIPTYNNLITYSG